MAVTKIWAIKDSLQRVLDYAANPDKTEYDALAQTLHYAENDAKTKLNESAQLVTGIHCRANHAWEDMRAVQERFGKADGVVALHAYQSFREGEVTPEQCHEIGVALARKVWGRRFQVLVATHMNTDNLHNHFVINSVSYVDGKKYEQRRSQYAEFRAASDKLCREYGLSVVEQPKAKEPERYARMREAIDQACEDASTAEDFHRALYRQGYIFGSDPNRRYATIRARDGGRAVRLYRLGEEYDLPAIDDRLRSNYLLYGPRLYERKHPPRQNTPKRYRPTENRSILQIFFEVFFGESQMHRLYLYYCYQLGILPKKQQPRINRPELERIWKDTEKILAEHAFVHDHKFPSLQAIVDYRKSLSQQMETLAAQRAEIVKQKQNARRESLWQEYKEIDTILDKIRSVGTGAVDLTDPHARELLQDRLQQEQNALDYCKAANAYYRKHKTLRGYASLTDEQADAITDPEAFSIKLYGKPYGDFELSSLRGKIKRVQARLADLDKLQAAAQQPDNATKFDGGEIVRNAEENRLQILFDEIPDADTRDALKSNGFRWSPRNKAWQRQLTQNAEYAARRVLGL